jgi:hypothetical protein
VVSTRISVTERPSHGNRAAPLVLVLVLRKRAASNPAHRGTP